MNSQQLVSESYSPAWLLYALPTACHKSLPGGGPELIQEHRRGRRPRPGRRQQATATLRLREPRPSHPGFHPRIYETRLPQLHYLEFFELVALTMNIN